DDYTATLVALPPLLAEAAAAAEAAAGDEHAAALVLLAQSRQVAGTVLVQLRSFDLAYRALDLALDAAGASGDRMVGASIVELMCWLLLRQSRFTEAERLAITTADAIEPRFSRAEPAHLIAWGRLMLSAAAAAVRDNRGREAGELLDAAEA